MIFIYGHRLYGKTDELPGLFHVASRFIHIYYVPLIPVASYVVLDQDGDHFRGVKVPLSLKSILLGWFRAALVILGLVLVGMMIFDPSVHGTVAHLTKIAELIGVVMLLVASVVFDRPNRDRAHAIADRIGLPREVIDAHYSDREEAFWAADIALPRARVINLGDTE